MIRILNYFVLIFINALLWHVSLSTHECNRTFTPPILRFQCPSSVTGQLLRLNDLTVAQLDSITSIVAGGWDSTTIGPFTSLPGNLCFFRNLQTIDFSFNQITDVDPTGSLTNCLTKVTSFNLQLNNLTLFPSALSYNMPNLATVNFRQNRLTDVPGNSFRNISILDTIDFSFNQLTTFELWVLEVRTRADFSNNIISAITNRFQFTKFLNSPDLLITNITLTNNGPTINLTDGIYEMADQCNNLNLVLANNLTVNQPEPTYFTRRLGNLNLGTTRITCSCDQAYILKAFDNVAGDIDQSAILYELPKALCSSTPADSRDVPFYNSTCSPPNRPGSNSSVDFSRVYPRFCRIISSEDGELTTPIVFPLPTSNAPRYPHYVAAFLNPGACLFTFNSDTTMSVSNCNIEVSNSNSRMPGELANSSYITNITNVIFPNRTSLLPSYLCSLPSKEINLNDQAFTTLTAATFPCLDWFTKVTLARNQITSVNMPNGNFQSLTTLDLSSNALSGIPYSILRPSPSSLRILDLRNNSLNAVDLFLYTLKNITVYLDNNPINSSNIINPENVIVDTNSTSTVNITWPPGTTDTAIVLTDANVVGIAECPYLTSIQNLRAVPSFQRATIRCTCLSFGLKELYQANGSNITDYWNCSDPRETQNFLSLNRTICSSAIVFSTAPCDQISTDASTMTSLDTSFEYTSIPFTANTTSSLLSSSLVSSTSNHSESSTPSSGTIHSETVTSLGQLTSQGTSLTGNTTSENVTLSANMTSHGSTTPSGDTVLLLNTTSQSSTVPTNATSHGSTTPAGGTAVMTNTTSESITLSANVTSPNNSTALGGTNHSDATTVTSPTASQSTTPPSATSSNNSTFSGSTTSSSGTILPVNTTSGNSTALGMTNATTISMSLPTNSTSTTTASTTVAPSPILGNSGRQATTDNTPLIVGLVVGLVGFFILLAILTALICYFKFKKDSGKKKPKVSRARANGRSAGDALSSRVQARNPRAVRLAPLAPAAAAASALPTVPVKTVLPPTKSSLLNESNLTSQVSPKGIPVRLDPIRSPTDINPKYPPNSNALNNSASFRPINNLPPLQTQPPPPQYQVPRPQKPGASNLLNTGGNMRP